MSHPLVLYRHSQPGYYDIVHHYVEQRRGHESALCCTPCDREYRSMEVVLYRHHMLSVPESLQEPTYLRAHSIPLQCGDKAVPVHIVICLPKVQEYQEEGVLVYSVELMGEIYLYYSHTHPSSIPEPVEDVVHLQPFGAGADPPVLYPTVVCL